MPANSGHVHLNLDRKILEHPHARHLRRMRVAVWLYLDLLARLPAKADRVEISPVLVASDMGLPEGTVRSWLGHLRKAGYVTVTKLDGNLQVTVQKGLPEEPPPAKPILRFFTVAKLQRALGETGNREALQAALNLYPDDVVKRALARALAVPEHEIKKSRTALFLYLVKHYGQNE